MNRDGLSEKTRDLPGRLPGRLCMLIAGGALFLPLVADPIAAQETFLNSRSHGEEGAIVGVLLTDDEYARMVREAEHRDIPLDWAWVEGRMNKGKVETLGFSIDGYRTIVVRPPEDHTPERIDGLAGQVDEALRIACKRLGWTPGDEGDLVLATAIVGVHDSDGYGITNFFNATGKHAVELEFRLVDSATGNTLLAARHEGHSANLIGAAWRATAYLAGFLAEPAAPRYSGSGRSVAFGLYEMPQSGKKNKPQKLEKIANPRAIALKALDASALFGRVVDGEGETDYRLDVRVAEADWVGAYQTTVNLDATYTLTDTQTGQVTFEENVVTSTTMSAREVASGSKRMKRVAPAAFLDNIDVFLYRLDAELRAGV